jgi:3' exoribonuclease, RNase T-like
MPSLMIDIESLATTPDAVILTIAAQSFDPLGHGYLDRHYYARITLESQEDRAINEETIKWWATQTEAQAEAFNELDRVDLDTALAELYRLAWQHDLIFAQGPTFDINILEHAYRSRNHKQPWQYYKIRDSRTVTSLWPDCPKPPASHHALEDCRRQIDLVQLTLKHLNIKSIK